MKYINQNRYGKQGNCLEACISSLTGIPLDNFPDMSGIESTDGAFWKILNNWLRVNHGIYVDSILFDFDNSNKFERGLMIAVGDSPSLKDELHAVLWDMDSNKMIFDPSPLNEGLKGKPKSFCMLIKYFRIHDSHVKSPSLA